MKFILDRNCSDDGDAFNELIYLENSFLYLVRNFMFMIK